MGLRWPTVGGAARYRVDWPGALEALSGVAWARNVNTTTETSFVDRTVPCATERAYTVTALAASGAVLSTFPPARARSAPCPARVRKSGHDVFVQYYPWYGLRGRFGDPNWLGWQIDTHARAPEHINSDFYPLGGLYSVRDGALLDRQMRQMRRAGITVIVYEWNGIGSQEDVRAPKILEHAAKHGLRVAWMIDAHGKRSAASLPADVAHITSRYGSSPAFYRTKRPGLNQPARPAGQGLFFVWAPHINCYARYGPPCGRAVEPSYWGAAADAIHRSRAGGIVLANGNLDLAAVRAAHMDGVYLYGILPPGSAADYRSRAVSWPKNAWFIPHAMPGFNNRCSWADFTLEVGREDGRFYDRHWEGMLSGPALYGVGVTSWNEWHEGTQIEPALYGYRGNRPDRCRYSDYGTVGSYGYLYKTQRWAAKLARMPLPESYASRRAVSEGLGPRNRDDGLYQLDVGDGRTKAAHVSGRPARSPLPASSSVRYLYFAVENQFAWQLPAGTRMTFSVTFRDEGSGPLRVQYDGAGGIRTSPTVHSLAGTGRWRTVSFALPDAYLGSRLNRYTDLRLVVPGGRDLWVAAARLARG